MVCTQTINSSQLSLCWFEEKSELTIKKNKYKLEKN